MMKRGPIDRTKRKQYKEYWMAQGYSEEESVNKAIQYNRSNNRQCVEYYEKRFPEHSHDEHLKMIQEFKKHYAEIWPDNSGVNNPNHKSKTTLQERKSRSPYCIEFYEKRFPGKTKNEYEQMVRDAQIQAKSKITPDKHSTRIEYWLAKGMTEEEAKYALKQRQTTFTLNGCIKKYGEEEGRKRYNDRQVKWQKTLREKFIKNGYNGIHQSSFANNIINILKDMFSGSQKEYNIDRYSFDFEWNKHLIEFNGDYWHMNPNKYKATDINKTSKKTAQFIWESDEHKYNVAKSNGYRLFIVWESDYKNDPMKIINDCICFLNN